ncbi:MAG: hypothetical protein IJ064_06950 [Bacteroidaceae bacterium]|nr:hypothetical protein [Bacteroidaceae bacterium]
MKKIYLQPTTTETPLLLVQFLAHSIEGAESVTESDDINEDDEGDAKSDKDWDIWEDEYDYDHYYYD